MGYLLLLVESRGLALDKVNLSSGECFHSVAALSLFEGIYA